MNSFYAWKENSLILQIHLQPQAKKDEIVGVLNHHLKIKIQAAPIENKANKRLIKFLAKQFGVPATHVEIIKGHQSKQKVVLINEPRTIDTRLGINK